jgi:hypothetical protein
VTQEHRPQDTLKEGHTLQEIRRYKESKEGMKETRTTRMCSQLKLGTQSHWNAGT